LRRIIAQPLLAESNFEDIAFVFARIQPFTGRHQMAVSMNSLLEFYGLKRT
jgi:hypothetical protein